jgi:Mn-dependent DtxR family transcriptional regulator
MKIQESGENYLETILILKNKGIDVRSIDIAHELNYSKPSVSRAMRILKNNSYLTVNDLGYIELTSLGQEIASKIYERHTLISTLLIDLGVNPDVAAQDACRIEHVISEESFSKLKKYLKIK